MHRNIWEYVPPLGSHVELPHDHHEPPVPDDEDYPDDFDDDDD